MDGCYFLRYWPSGSSLRWFVLDESCVCGCSVFHFRLVPTVWKTLFDHVNLEILLFYRLFTYLVTYSVGKEKNKHTQTKSPCKTTSCRHRWPCRPPPPPFLLPSFIRYLRYRVTGVIFYFVFLFLFFACLGTSTFSGVYHPIFSLSLLLLLYLHYILITSIPPQYIHHAHFIACVTHYKHRQTDRHTRTRTHLFLISNTRYTHPSFLNETLWQETKIEPHVSCPAQQNQNGVVFKHDFLAKNYISSLTVVGSCILFLTLSHSFPITVFRHFPLSFKKCV